MGTVTFLFTDVEGSTRQATADAAAWSAARARYHEILRAAIDAHDGFAFRVVGDAFFAAFSTVGRAVAAALGAERGLDAERWPVRPVKVGMGLSLCRIERGESAIQPARRGWIHSPAATPRTVDWATSVNLV
jgi:class 3 adenylate cyclase